MPIGTWRRSGARGTAVALGVASALAALALASAGAAPGNAAARAPRPASLPERLADTGLYAGPAADRVAPGVLPFAPQYPLWSDGAAKRRWVRLPPGRSVDASDPDSWRFPVGTRFWKEFSLGGRRVETRYMVLGADGRWSYATYVWNAEGTEARRAPELGVRGAAESRPGVPYDVPGTADCRACHGGSRAEVLGFGALQLSSDRDPNAPHAVAPGPGAVDLAGLVARGLVQNLPAAVASRPPRIEARTPRARAALGYLHGNCASCHNARGPLAELGLSLEQRVAPGLADPLLRTAAGVEARLRPGGAKQIRVAPGRPEESLLVARVGSRSPILRMPPFGTHLVDEEAVALLSSFVREDLADHPATTLHAQSAHEEKSP